MLRPVSHLALGAALLALAGGAAAQDNDRNVRYTLFGTPGLIEMPSALSAPDGRIATTLGLFEGQSRVSLTFQITPRLSGTFRYSRVTDFDGPDTGQFYDRSFDLRYQLVEEGDFVPAIAVGLQDFMGTSLYSSEYLVATKALTDSIRVTAGIGWGRMGTYNSFDNPLSVVSDYFTDRPDGFNEGTTGGEVEFDRFFRGPAALFGGVEWAVTDDLMVKVEYSSDDAYQDRRGNDLLDRASPLNFGLSWRPRPSYMIEAGYLYGSTFYLSGTIMLNPNERPLGAGFDSAPVPVAVRPGDLTAAASWDAALAARGPLDQRLATALDREGITLESLAVDGGIARLRYTNTTFRSEAQAMGRVARILTAEMPAGVSRFTLEPMQRGLALSAVTLDRDALERLENAAGGSDALLAGATVTAAGGNAGLTDAPQVDSPFTWGLFPYVTFTVFDASNPVQVDAGLRLRAEYQLTPNLIASGRLRIGLLDIETPEPLEDSPLPPVRTSARFYTYEGNPGIENLQLAWYGRPGPNLYSRLTVGYLERMYGGVSAELLWKPVDSRMAIGAEINHVWQRDYDMLLGFRDYDVTTGHVSAYYDFQNGFHAQVDVGRYLAGDLGATFALDRQFDNGWRVGAYFTLTDVPFEDFGEGSFDKGIRLTIPTDYIFGTPSRRELSNTLASLNRDGGARLNVDGRLYETVRDGHLADLSDGWGRFWR